MKVIYVEVAMSVTCRRSPATKGGRRCLNARRFQGGRAHILAGFHSILIILFTDEVAQYWLLFLEAGLVRLGGR